MLVPLWLRPLQSLFHRVQLDPLEKDWLRSSALGNMAAQRLLLAQEPSLVLKKVRSGSDRVLKSSSSYLLFYLFVCCFLLSSGLHHCELNTKKSFLKQNKHFMSAVDELVGVGGLALLRLLGNRS